MLIFLVTLCDICRRIRVRKGITAIMARCRNYAPMATTVHGQASSQWQSALFVLQVAGASGAPTKGHASQGIFVPRNRLVQALAQVPSALKPDTSFLKVWP